MLHVNVYLLTAYVCHSEQVSLNGEADSIMTEAHAVDSQIVVLVRRPRIVLQDAEQNFLFFRFDYGQKFGRTADV